MFSPSLSQSSHRTKKSIPLLTIYKCFAITLEVLSSCFTVGAYNGNFINHKKGKRSNKFLMKWIDKWLHQKEQQDPFFYFKILLENLY